MDKSETGLLNEEQNEVVVVENPVQHEGLLCYVKLFLILFPILSLGAVTTANSRLITDQLIYQKLGGDINGHSNTSTVNHGNSNGSTAKICDSAINKTKEDHIQSEATMFSLYMSSASCISAFIFVPVWGALSDASGRHFALTAFIIGSIISNASLLAVSKGVPMWILILGDGLHGMLGKSNSGILLVTSAYIADTLGPGKRTLMMIIADFILLTFMTITTVGAGYWIKSSGFNGVLITCLVLQGLLLLYSVCIFSRVQQPNTQLLQEQDLQTTISFSSKIKLYFTKSYQTFTKPRIGYIRACLLLLMLTTFSESIGMYAVESVQTIYCLGPPLCWNSVMLGIFKGIKVGLEGLLPLIIGIVFFKAGPSAWLVFAGLLGTGLQSIMFGFATTDLLMYIAVLPGTLHALVPAVTRSILTDLVDSSEQGAALSGYIIIAVVAELLSQSSFKTVYAATLAIFNRLVFFIAAVFILASIGSWGGFGLAKRKSKKSMDMYKPLVQ